MEIHVKLYSIRREKLPPEARGQTVLQLEDGATLSDILEEFGISRRVVIGVNGEHEPNRSRQLLDQDEIKIFSSVSGG
jgi:sulfur carrier protein ThiS